MKRQVPQLLIFLFLILLVISCKKRTDQLGPDIPDPGNPGGQLVNTDFIIYALDDSHKPLADVDVSIGSVTKKTNKLGIATFYNASVSESRAFIKAAKKNYHSNFRVLQPQKNKINHIRIELTEQRVEASIPSTGGEITTMDGVKIKLPANPVSGYSGNIRMAVKYIDATDQFNIGSLPGDLVAINSTNQVGMLDSYGMISVDLLDGSGNKLQLAVGKQADIEIPIPASKKTTAPASIPLWHFDESVGIWKSEGEARLQGDRYVGKVSHFSWWNADLFLNTKNYCLDISINDTLKPENLIINAIDKISGMGVSIIGNGCITLPVNADGSPRVWEFGFWVSGLAGEKLCRVGVVTKTSNEVVNGSMLKFNLSYSEQLRPILLKGKATKCDGTLISNGMAVVRHNGQTNISVITNGQFNFSNQLICLSSNSQTIELVVYDYDNNKESIPQTLIIDDITLDVGTLQTCSTITDSHYKPYNRDLNFFSQEAIDHFASQGYTHIFGDVRISNYIVTNLKGLSSIKSISGDLTIEYTRISSLEGLDNLAMVGGNLKFGEGVESITNFQGLGKLVSIRGYFYFQFLERLLSFEGLNSLTKIGGGFSFYRGNPHLKSFKGLEKLTTIEGGLVVGGESSIESFSGLNNLRFVEGNFNLSESNKMTSFEGLENLSTISGNFGVGNNKVLRTFKGLGNLSHIGGRFVVGDNDLLLTMEGLDNLTLISGTFELDQTGVFSSFRGLEKLNRIGGSFLLAHATVQSLKGLDNLKIIDGSFWIGNVKELQSFEGLENLESIGGNVYVNSPDLTSLNGLNRLKSVGGDMTIEINNNISSMSGLNNLTTVGGLFKVSHLVELLSFTGLEKIEKVNSLEIEGNNKLTTLNGLNTLKHAVGVGIYSNSNLNNFCALNTLVANSPRVGIRTYSNKYNVTLETLLMGICSP